MLIITAAGDQNVKVNAVAGSGKTTTILGIAAEYPEKKYLLFTYNSRLCAETKLRVRDAGLRNIAVYTYHSFAYHHLGGEVKDDESLAAVLAKVRAGTQALQHIGFDDDIQHYDTVIFDEIQDMNLLYYELAQFIIQAYRPQTIISMGDIHQAIFIYAGADPRYLSMSPVLFGAGEWQDRNLQTSYRMTRQLVAALNHCMLHNSPISLLAARDGPKPQYIIGEDIESLANRVYALVQEYGAGEVFVLVNSTKRKKFGIDYVRKLENAMVDRKVNIFMVDDEGRVDTDVIKGKLCILNFARIKGLERKAAVVLGFDSSYMKASGDLKMEQCPNALYVALTRAKERLVIYHGADKEYLPFVDVESLELYFDVIGGGAGGGPVRLSGRAKKYNVTDLVKHLPSSLLIEQAGLIKYTTIVPAQPAVVVKGKCEQAQTIEGVADITGTAIPNWYQYTTSGCMHVFDEAYKSHKAYLDKAGYEKAPATIPDLLKFINITHRLNTGIKHRLRQITTYNWITPADMDACAQILDLHLKDAGALEWETLRTLRLPAANITGRLDVVQHAPDGDIVWELKCITGNFAAEHKLQLAIYALLDGCKRRYRLLNIFTGEVLELQPDADVYLAMVRELVAAKLQKIPPISDDKFMAQAIRVREEWGGPQ